VPVLVAGAVLGVLTVLGALLVLIGKLDDRYYPRREAMVRLDSIQASLDDIKQDFRDHLDRS
jgi:uncharacterized membrane-anchored protein YhcB (DUF1043 family)